MIQNVNEPSKDPAQIEVDERRTSPRFFARAKVDIFRESDAMRNGVPARLHDISIAGLGLTTDDQPLDLLEVVKIRISNEIQRFEREVRGVVRHVTPLEDGGFRIGIELMTRLTPLEVSLLKMIPIDGAMLNDDGSVWV